jgi:hypothetical protein
MQSRIRKPQPFMGHFADQNADILIFRPRYHIQTVHSVAGVFFVLVVFKNRQDPSLPALQPGGYATRGTAESVQNRPLTDPKGTGGTGSGARTCASGQIGDSR